MLLFGGSLLSTTSARPSGISGVPNGCICHSGSAADDIVVSLDGVPEFYGDEFNSTFLKELAKDRVTPKTEFAKKPEKVEVMKNESPGKDSPLSKAHNPDPREKK